MAENSQKGRKTLREKEKLLVTSNFSFSYSVLKRPILLTIENKGLFGKGLMKIWNRPSCNERSVPVEYITLLKIIKGTHKYRNSNLPFC